MELKMEMPRRRGAPAWLCPALLFCALCCAASGLLDLFSPAAFLGVVPLLAVGVLPKRRRAWGLAVLLALLLGFLALRFSAVTDGLKLLANRVFERSEAQQAYEYEYFSVSQSGAALREGLAFASLAAALLFCLRGGLALTGAFLLAQAYFGVTASAGWLVALLFSAALQLLPQERRWMSVLLTALFLGLVTLLVFVLAPEPNIRISGWEEQARDRLALHSIYYERTPEQVELPQEPTSPPPEQEAPPSEAVTTPRAVNVLFLVLLALTLLLLFVPAVLRDRARKKREKNRAGFTDADPSAAIRAMYLHSRRWLRLRPEPIPDEIEALWLLAAYSDHRLAQEQRAQMEQYLAGVEQRVWQSATRWERLQIRYCLCL